MVCATSCSSTYTCAAGMRSRFAVAKGPCMKILDEPATSHHPYCNSCTAALLCHPKRHGKSRRRPLVFTNTSCIISALKPRGLDGLNIRCVSKRCCAKSCRVMRYCNYRTIEMRKYHTLTLEDMNFVFVNSTWWFTRAFSSITARYSSAVLSDTTP